MRRTVHLARTALRPATLRELRELASAAALYPFGISSAANTGLLRLLASDRAVSARTVRTPVVLVHGYGGNRSNWLPLHDRLAAAGFVNLHAMLYNPLTSDLPGIAARLTADCEAACRDAGVDRVHVVGHSLGGVVLRYAVARLGLGRHLDVGMTIASPHGGAPVARLGRGAVAVDLRPGSALLRELAAAPSPAEVRWVCYWSDADHVVAPSSARLSSTEPGALDVHVPEQGHLSILRAPALLADAVERLLAAEDAAPTAAASADAALAA